MDKATFRKKWENYWYYHKYHTIAGIFLLFVVIVLVQQCATKVNPDVTVVIATQNMVLTSDEQNALQTYFSKITQDVNKDGKKAAELDVMNMGDSQAAAAEQEKLVAELSIDSNVVYILDDGTYDILAKSQSGIFEKITDLLPDEKLSNPYKLPVSGTTLAGQSFGKSMNGLSVCTRIYSSTLKNKKKAPSINNALTIVKKIASK